VYGANLWFSVLIFFHRHFHQPWPWHLKEDISKSLGSDSFQRTLQSSWLTLTTLKNFGQIWGQCYYFHIGTKLATSQQNYPEKGIIALALFLKSTKIGP
jgi:hypothetical protein